MITDAGCGFGMSSGFPLGVAREGADLVLNCYKQDQKKMEAFVEELESYGIQVCVIEGDMEMSRNVQSGNTQNLKSMVIQRSFPKWSVAERRKTAAASDQAAVCACAHSRYFAGGSPSGLRV